MGIGKKGNIEGGFGEAVIAEGAEFADIWKSPVVLSGESQLVAVLESGLPGHRLCWCVGLPDESGLGVGEGAIRIVLETGPQSKWGITAHATGVNWPIASGADGFEFGVGPDSATGVDDPDF
ncbi:MAG: hypothetical protein RLZZ458_157 [Planctomycetota bacterium]